MEASVVLSMLSLLLCADSSRANHRAKNKNSTNSGKPPHIIFILIDDQGFNDIGYHNPSIRTPTLDKLSSEGVRLENYYVQPICTPSRSQLLTGRYQIHTGLQHSIIRPRQPSCLPPHLDTLPQRLREAGYSTHLVGKWHLGFYRKACLPTRKGFDTFFGSLTGSVDYYSYGSCDGPGVCGYDLHENESVAWGHEGRYSTALFTQKARRILEKHDPEERPLFLLLSLQAVHTPLLSPKSYIYPYRDMTNVNRRKFAAMVSTVDEAVRNVTYALRKYGFYKNSVLVYSTDNGAQPFTGGSNWPLRGRKGTYWEGGLRGVAFVHSPLIKLRRRVSTDLLHITDWFPTLVRLGQGDSLLSKGLDGFDVWDTISEGRPSPRTEILHNIDPLHKPYSPSASWDSSGDASALKPKRPMHKKPQKKKKKILRQKPHQKSAFKLKKKNKRTHPNHLHVSKTKKNKMVKVRPKKKEKIVKKPVKKRKRNSSAEKPTSKSHLKKSKTVSKKVKLKPKLRFYNETHPSPQPSSEPSTDALWDTSVQAAIRVGDWKLLTGDPGHGDWVPPQVLSSLPGRWWNLERSFSFSHKSLRHKNIWLFNISCDPYEREDVSDQHPEVVKRLLTRLVYYNQSSVPVFFPPDDPRANPSRHRGAWVPWVLEEGHPEEDPHTKYHGVYKKGKNSKKKKRKKGKCHLCKLKSFFQKFNTGMMSNKI